MKSVNRFIIFMLLMLAGGWAFNHINAWVGILICLITFYVALAKVIKDIKDFENFNK